MTTRTSKLPAAKFSRQIAGLRRSLLSASEPAKAVEIGAGAAGIEEMMRKSGLYRTDEIRPVRELVLDSRWVLGRLLRKVLRGTGPGRGKKVSRTETSFRAELQRLKLNKDRAVEAQRIGTLPEKEKAKTYADAERQDVLPTVELLIDVARPYWYQENRKQKHRTIAAKAAQARAEAPDSIGPFPLIYADPPWQFSVYSEKGMERSADQHYPTMSDEEIIGFQVSGQSVTDIAAADAALLMWCTSSNVERALEVMRAWGFTYKSQAVWVKLGMDGRPIAGTGYIFRNMHELLLYGTRGEMPAPQYQPPSVIMTPRMRHSAKPPEVRAEIERMYPDFDSENRLEIFARGTVEGWTTYGNEAVKQTAEKRDR